MSHWASLFLSAGFLLVGNSKVVNREPIEPPLGEVEIITKRIDDVKIIVEEGVDVNYICTYQCTGWTPLMIAAANNHPEVVRYLISKGADVNIANRMGRTALHFATNYEFKDIVEMLLNAGANPNATSQDTFTPNTPVKAAIARENTEILKLLLKSGGDKNTEFNGVSILQLAGKKNDLELKSLLAL